jgi:CDP-glucose 4,6-dehydratase
VRTQALKDVYQGKTVLVTGHTGFKGSWLSSVLVELGANVTGFSLTPTTESLFRTLNLKDRVNHFIGDIRNFELINAIVEQSKPEIVFHLAAQSLISKGYKEPKYTFETNVQGTVNLLECYRVHQFPALVIITSDKCYQPKLEPCTEEDPLGGLDPYSSSKAAVEVVVNGYRPIFPSLNLATARGGNAIGPGDRTIGRLFPDILRAFQSESSLKVRNPNALRPFQHVLDPIWGYLMLGKHLMQGNLGGAWNFGPQRSVKVSDIIEQCQHLYGRRGKIMIEKRDQTFKESQTLLLSSEKAKQQLNWSCRLDWKEMLQWTLADEWELNTENAQSLILNRIYRYEEKWKE